MFSGQGFKKVTVSFDGHLFNPMNRTDVVTAHALQMACLYNFGVSYETGKNGKPLPKKFKYFYEFTSVYFWKIRARYASSGTGKIITKRVSPEVQRLMSKISPDLDL